MTLTRAIAGQGLAGRVGAGEVLDIGQGGKGVGGKGGADLVAAFAGKLGDDVADIVDDIGVVAGEAGHRVGAEAAVDDVVRRIAVKGLVRSARDR